MTAQEITAVVERAAERGHARTALFKRRLNAFGSVVLCCIMLWTGVAGLAIAWLASR